MLVYYFTKQKYGLDDLTKKRLKLAIINDLNDPFELLGADLRNKRLRREFQRLKERMSACSGFLCFSAKWTNPAQWAHYADNHRGLCFGFDVKKGLKKIHYCDKRAIIPGERFLTPENFDTRERDRLFYTKAKCWEYEEERRLLFAFEYCQREKGHHFVPFSDNLVLRKVYVGASSTLPEAKLKDAMGDLSPGAEIIKVRPAFGSFSLTPDNRWPPHWAMPRRARLRAQSFAQLREKVTW